MNSIEKPGYGKSNQEVGFGVRHLQVVLVFFSTLVSYSLRVIASLAIVAITDSKAADPNSKTYDWDSEVVSLVLSSFFLGYVLLQIPVGYLGSKWSAKGTLCIGLFASGITTGLAPILIEYGDWQALCAGRILLGVAQCCLYPCCHTILAKWCPPQERASLGTFAYAGAHLGTVIATLVSGQLAASEFGWPSIFYTFGSVSILLSMAIFFLGSNSPSVHPFISEDERNYIEDSLRSSSSKQETVKTPWKAMLTSVPAWALICVQSAQGWGFWLLFTEIPIYLNKIVGFDIKDNGIMSALPYLFLWLLSFPMSYASDYASKRGVPPGRIRKISNSIGHWGPAIALLALCFIDTKNQVVPVIILILAVGLNAGTICGYQINHIDLTPVFAGTLMSIGNTIGSVLGIFAPLVCGLIVKGDQKDVHQWHEVFYISTFIYVVGNLIFVLFGQGEVQWWNNAPSQPEKKASTVSVAEIYYIQNLTPRKDSKVVDVVIR